MKKDFIVRREWGSQERIVIDECYVPEPFSALMAQGSDLTTPNSRQSNAIPYNDTSSTSESDENSNEIKKTGYEKIIKEFERKKGPISKEDFSIVSLIGTGSYGKVFLVRKIDTQQIYAMKVLRKSFIRKYK